jgi:hypothetical protein
MNAATRRIPGHTREMTMTMRVVHTYATEVAGADVRVYRESEWQEYMAVVRVDGVRLDATSYHTDNRADALATAERMARDYHPA